MTWGKWQLREKCGEEHMARGDRWERGMGKEMGQDRAEWKTHGGRWKMEENQRFDKRGDPL
jgi:hypothetical protein